jgi:hypothetical protein
VEEAGKVPESELGNVKASETERANEDLAL